MIEKMEKARALEMELHRLLADAERERFDMLAYLIEMALREAQAIQRQGRRP